MSSITRLQRGFSLVTAVFLIVFLAALGGFVVSVFTVQQTTLGLDMAGVRAYQAAQAGIEWGAYRILRPAAPLCVASSNLAGLPGSLAPYSATVACTVSGPHSEGGTNVSIYTLTATACRPAGAGGVCPNPAPGADYVERQVTATVER